MSQAEDRKALEDLNNNEEAQRTRFELLNSIKNSEAGTILESLGWRWDPAFNKWNAPAMKEMFDLKKIEESGVDIVVQKNLETIFGYMVRSTNSFSHLKKFLDNDPVIQTYLRRMAGEFALNQVSGYSIQMAAILERIIDNSGEIDHVSSVRDVIKLMSPIDSVDICNDDGDSIFTGQSKHIDDALLDRVAKLIKYDGPVLVINIE